VWAVGGGDLIREVPCKLPLSFLSLSGVCSRPNARRYSRSVLALLTALKEEVWTRETSAAEEYFALAQTLTAGKRPELAINERASH
jgi:hypothetical protein